MDTQDHQYFDGRQRRTQYSRNPSSGQNDQDGNDRRREIQHFEYPPLDQDDQESHTPYFHQNIQDVNTRQSRTPFFHDSVGVQNFGQREPIYPTPLYPRQPPPLNPRGQIAANMPNPYKSRAMTFTMQGPIAPQYVESHEPHIGQRPYQPGVPRLPRIRRSLRRDQENLARQPYASSAIQDSRPIAMSPTNIQQGTGRQLQPGKRFGSQWSDQVLQPDHLDSADEDHKISDMSSSIRHDYNNSFSARATSSSPTPREKGGFGLVTHIAVQNSRHEDRHDPNVQVSAKGQHGKDSKVKTKLGADGKAVGLTQFNHRGELEHREAKEIVWKPAVYHEELRDALIAEASLLGTYG